MNEKSPAKIKICYVANMEAVWFLLLSHIRFLKGMGYEVTVVCSNGRFVQELISSGISIKIIDMPRKISPFTDLLSLIRLILYFCKERFYIVHTHNPKPSLLGQAAAFIARVPIRVYTIHGFYFGEESSPMKKRVFVAMERLTCWFSNFIFFINRTTLEIAEQKKICQGRRMMYVGNGINLRHFTPQKFSSAQIATKKEKIGIPRAAKVVGIVARLVKEKGYLELFDAWKAIKSKVPEALLLIIGPFDPIKRDSLDKQLLDFYIQEGSIIFLGERKDLDELYSVMDLFVLPSHREGLPYTLLEASAMEKPIIATNVGGCKEVVEHKKTGLLIPPKNSAELAHAILHMLSNPDQARIMGENARKKVEKEFDEQLVFQRIARAYHQVLSVKNP
ncbi:MAG: glycosyltransferase family 4 protein [Candidatus Wildermuthbacteria bacterium]|nr:glycosyltransferase family 4 protein [Candidatus Wildermuthbacteria bacterium]